VSEIDVFSNLPEINLLDEEGITYDGIVDDMVADYQARYRELTGEDLTLYPADSRRLMINTVAGKLYQLAAIMNERHRLNFLQYMYGPYLRNWGSNFGFTKTGLESAKTVLRFKLAAASTTDVTIPAGTRATSGDHVYFEVDEDTVIAAGELYADTSATCTTQGTIGNGYTTGQINIIVDPVNLVEAAENISQSSGGHDEYTDQELRELIYNCQDSYTTAGSKGSYKEITKQYSANITDVKVVSDYAGEVAIYLLLQDGNTPDDAYCNNVLDYINNLGLTPDTDKVSVLAPSIVTYTIEATYYIPYDNKEIADGIKEAIKDAAAEFVDYTQSRIGRAVNPNTLIAFATAAGASRIAISSPNYSATDETSVAACKNINLTFGGYDRE
jgi:phage-related baseplate assembly protein